jgi:hypothetical protein
MLLQRTQQHTFKGGAEVIDTSANQRTPARSGECVIYAKPSRRGHFYWGWHSSDGRRRSRTVFAYFYDCLTDARRNGYEIDPAEVVAQLRGTKLTIEIVPNVVVREPETELDGDASYLQDGRPLP